MKALTIILIAALFTSCTNREGAIEALKDAGYKGPYKVGGYAIFGCSQDDFYSTNFSAFSPDSTRVVSGCVCQGLFKGKTIRLE